MANAKGTQKTAQEEIYSQFMNLRNEQVYYRQSIIVQIILNSSDSEIW